MFDDPLEYGGVLPTVHGRGSRVAGYLLEEQVGAGGMAIVYRARDVRLGRLVALKVMTPAIAGDEDFRRRFVREARAAAAVDDPHIIPVYEAGEAGGVLFLAMRFVSGGDVRSLLRREGPLTPDRMLSVISPVASALDAAHAAGLIHRDVKPANMLLDVRPGRVDHVYLSDFGLSKSVQSGHLTQSGQFLGTPDYAAPEQIQGAAADGRTDQYALACAVFELLTGKVPFARSEGWATVWAHLNTPPPTLTALRPGLPPAADKVLAKAMAKAPPERYATCGEFASALHDALSSASPSRRRRYGVAVVAGTVVLAAATVSTVLALSAQTGASAHGANRVPLYSRIAAFTPARVPGQWQDVTSVAFSPDGKQLAIGLTTGHSNVVNVGINVGLYGGRTSVWDVATRKQSAVLARAGGAEAFSADGKLLAAVGGTGRRFVYRTNPAAGTAIGKTALMLPGTGKEVIENVAFSPLGDLLAANDYDGIFYLWSATSGRLIRKTGVKTYPLTNSLAIGPDGKTLATGSLGGVTLWNLVTGRQIGMLSSAQDIVTTLAFSPNGALLADDDAGGVDLWDMTTRKHIATLTDPASGGAEDVAFSPDSDMLAVGDANGKTYLWNLRTDKLAAVLVNPVGPAPPGLPS